MMEDMFLPMNKRGRKQVGLLVEKTIAATLKRMEATYSDQMRQDEALKTRISARLTQSGEKERLKELLRVKLADCGWRDEMQLLCKEVIRSKGIHQVTVEDLIEEITPKGRASVPEDVRKFLLEKIKAFIETEAGIEVAESNA